MKIAFLAIAVLVTTCAHAGAPLFPMHTGDRWTYDAEVEWTLANSNKTMTAKLTWTTQVVGIVKGPHGRAAIVKDFLEHLAWFDPAAPKKPAFDVIVTRPDGLWIDTDPVSEQAARETAKRAVAGENVGEQVLRFPLHDGDCVGSVADDPELAKGSYCWELTHDSDSTNPRAWQLFFRTMPDHQILDFTEGVGFTGYTYAHHGTVASAHASLRRRVSDK
jgi:hypothetical protein